MQNYIGHQGRSDAGARAHTGEDDAVRQAALLGGNPVGDHPVGGGKEHGFARAQREAHGEQHEQHAGHTRGHHGGEGGEDAPPKSAERDDEAGSEAIGEAAGGRLTQRVSHQEGAEDGSELEVGDVKLLLDEAAGDGDVDAVQEGDGADGEHPEDEEPADGHKNLQSYPAAARINRNSNRLWPAQNICSRLRPRCEQVGIAAAIQNDRDCALNGVATLLAGH